ncbi:hypothetical protein BZG36_01879 [Bifiguratus adelaidae]|uniref:RING-type domain-containing protein n=1 Tax=Bifiguratus adelaidae TaxID=1938954 RepID=A0A261Y2J1_9FUNG|nr:hypothetical protein BZG36_01879 [Bifiguratus adelaidae]
MNEWLKVSVHDGRMTEESNETVYRIEYTFEGIAPNLHPCIKIYRESPPSPPAVDAPAEDILMDEPESHGETQTASLALLTEFKVRKSSTGSFALSSHDLERIGISRDSLSSDNAIVEATDRHEVKAYQRQIELKSDSEFFSLLASELASYAALESREAEKYDKSIEELATEITVLATPQRKRQLYVWRQIMQLYMESDVFMGMTEHDRGWHGVETAKKQLAFFVGQMKRQKLSGKLQGRKSKLAFAKFMQLNQNLIDIRQFNLLNQTAIFKILKKHDKRSGLPAGTQFPRLLEEQGMPFNDDAAKKLIYAIESRLLTIVPQVDDYSCPVCMNVAWRPIRLACSHVFCVRCLLQAQAQNMPNCPICRATAAVAKAHAANLDKSLEDYIKTWFPKEVKEKRTEAEKENALRDMATAQRPLNDDEVYNEMKKMVGRLYRGYELWLPTVFDTYAQVAFIKQEALEKAREIKVKADEEFNIEKAKLVRQETINIDSVFQRKIKQSQIQRKIYQSNQINKSRLKVLEEREKMLEELFQDARNQLASVSKDEQKYQTLLNDLVLQGFFTMMEDKVSISCRAQDKNKVEMAIEDAKEKYKKALGKDVEAIVDGELPTDGAGGITLAGFNGRIKVDNTLEARVAILEEQMLPQIRVLLFGHSPNRKFFN